MDSVLDAVAPALEIEGLDVRIGGVAVLHGIDLSIAPGEVHLLFGPNGSGKSSLLKTIMGVGGYRPTAGAIRLFGHPVDERSVAERARLGLGMAFQGPPPLPGVTVAALGGALDATEHLAAATAALDLEGFDERSINAGFSGGETKRWEVCKLFLQRPRMLLFDEPEGGVDLEHVAVIGVAIRSLLDTDDPDDGEARAALVVSHTGTVLERIDADVGHLMIDGRIVHSGDPGELFAHIQHHGYRAPLTSGGDHDGRNLR